MDTDSPTIEPLAKRVAYFRRLFAKGVGRTPTALQKLAIARAAVMTAKAEAAALDPATTANDCVRLDGAAARARADMKAAIEADRPKPTLGPDSLRAYAASKYPVPA